MSKDFHELNTGHQELPDHAAQINGLIEAEIPSGAVSDQTIYLAAELLDKTYEEHGNPNSEDYKPYHNVPHSLNVLKRSCRLWRPLQEKLPEKFDNAGYTKLVLAACGHDIFVYNDSPAGEDEKRSADYTRDRMLESGYSQEDSDEVHEMIMATAVERDESGTIIQYNIQEGSKKPTKLILATADTNGVTMEGIPTLIDDGLNLWMEFSKTSIKGFLANPKSAVGFMLTQAKFLEDRLSFMNEDLALYFTEEEVEIIKDVFEDQFTGATRDALGAARTLARFPNLAELAVETSMRTAEKATGSSRDMLETAKGSLANLLSRTKRE